MNRKRKIIAAAAAILALVLLVVAAAALRQPSAPEPKPITVSVITPAPTAKPTSAPTAEPSAEPTAGPTATAAPTAKPTSAPAAKPTASPAAQPTSAPSAKPTAAPTAQPTAKPAGTPAPTPVPETVTISITCARALASDALPDGVRAVLPESGVILGDLTVPLQSGDTVWDVLQRVCSEQGVAIESDWTPAYNTAYVRGLGHLYEFDCGRGSGWLYRVNGVVPGVGCSSCALAAGDRIEWIYTCDFGNDV